MAHSDEKNEKTNNSSGFHIHVGGDVGNNSVIGDFSGNSGDINSNNVNSNNNAAEGEETKEQAFVRLSNELLQLLEQSTDLLEQEKKEVVDLVSASQPSVQKGEPNTTILTLLRQKLTILREKISQPSPILQNMASLSEVIGLFLGS
ncbi:hypothetical protein [Laceyella putida]|uniref:Uncharacterized protein n=1 Tax=Laceyella putida TaxID=110101 RepID=A0ABW2RQU3_9BACL